MTNELQGAKKKNLTDNQLYRIGKKSLERTPVFILEETEIRKIWGR